MKAMFEDYFGDSLTAQKNYRSADSAYAILIKEYATDSLRYAGSRINRALNMALMTDNIAILEEEVELTKRYFPRHGKDRTVVFTGKIKKTFSTNALTSAKVIQPATSRKLQIIAFERTDL